MPATSTLDLRDIEAALGETVDAGDDQRVRLRFVGGDVDIRLPAELHPDCLNWPSVSRQERATAMSAPAWRLDVVRMSSAIEARLAQLPGTDWQHCNRTGRGSFPSAWLPLPDGRLALYGEPRHLVWRRGSHVVLALQGCSDPGRWAQRTLRQLIVRAGQRRGLRLVHAAVLVEDGRGVLFVGDSGVGKTDLALRVAYAGGGSLVAVDRCLVGEVDGRLVASALPFGFNVAERTLAVLGVAPADLAGIRPPVLCKRYLDLSDVRRVCRVVVADRCEIAGVVRLHRPPAPYGATVWPMSPAAAAAVVTDELGYVDPGFPTDWLGVLEGTAPTPRPDVTGVAGLETWVPPGSAESYDAVRRWLANDLTLSGTAGDGEGNG